MQQTEKKEEFTLVPRKNHKTIKPWYPECLKDFEVATPFEECVTIMVHIKIGRKIEKVPVVWSPVTKKIKQVHKESWKELGVDEKLSRIRNRVIQLATAEHKRRAQRFATLPLFSDGTSH